MYRKGNNALGKRNKDLEVISLYSGNFQGRFYLRQLSKLSGLPLKTCQNVLAGLEAEKVVRSATEGKNKYFSLNLENISTKSYLLQAEIYKTDNFLTRYPQFKTFMKSVHSNTSLVVFGSFAKLKADKDSDVDLLVISKEKSDLPFHLLPYEVHQINLSEDSLKKALAENENVIKEIEENHVVLNNPSHYVNIMWEYYGK